MNFDTLSRFLDEKKRIKSWPAKHTGKLLVLEYLAEKFDTGRIYTEKEVNAIICDWHSFEDYFLLRRELILKKLLERKKDGSAYWKPEAPISIKAQENL